jgi:hypothetical protein
VGRQHLLKLGITRGLPKMPLRHEFVHTPPLAPPYWLFSELDRSVFEPKFRRHLDRSLGVAGALTLLRRAAEAGGASSVVLLCFEDVRRPAEWCHHLVVADWIAEGIERLGADDVRVKGELPGPSSSRPPREG